MPTSSQIIGLCLFITVCISKHLIILNEEILVACSFLAFLVFSSKVFSQNLETALHARTFTTQSELQHFLNLQLATTRELCHNHKQYLQTRAALNTVSKLVCAELLTTAKAGKQVRTLCFEQTKQRADTLIAQHANFQTKLQIALISLLRKQ